MSQETLANLIGVTFQQVQKYEKGTNRMAATRLMDVAVALNVPITYFFEGLEEKTPEGIAAIQDVLAVTSEEQKLLTLFRKASRGLQRQVLALIGALSHEDTDE